MNLEPAPRLSKTVFFAIDAGLLLTAFIVAYFAKDPYAPLPFVSAVLCVVVAAVIGFIPFLADYAAEQNEAAHRLREQTEGQIARLHAAGESLARAAAQIKAVEEAVHKSAREAETLPYRMQEKLAEFNEALATRENEDHEALERELDELRAANSDQLKAVADKIAKAAADWTALEVATRKQLTAAEAALAKLQAGGADAAARFEEKSAAALGALEAKLTEFKQVLAAAKVEVISVAPPAAPVAPPPDATADVPEAPAPDAAEPAPAPAASPEVPAGEPPKPKKPRTPRKPKPEDVLTAMSSAEETASPAEAAPAASPEPAEPATPATPAPEPIVSVTVEDTPAGDSDPAEAPAKAEASTSSDGATRLLATAYIGIGNKLFIRGDGPGLSWDKGAPMQFVSIGKWGWHTHDAAGPVRIKLYKNDDTPCMTGEITLEPGKHTEVTALF